MLETVDAPIEIEEVETSAPAVDSTPVAVPNLLDRAKAAFKSGPSLEAENRILRADNSDFQSQVSEMQSQIQNLTEENANLIDQESALTSIIEAAEISAKTATQTAIDMVAATGIPAADLPAQEAEAEPFEGRYANAKAAGPVALSKFMIDNKAEVNTILRGH